jgi:hypothetical protein
MLDVYINIFFLALLICLFFLKLEETTPEQKILGVVILITFPVELYGGYLQWYKLNNLFIYHVLVPIQYSIYASIYYLHIASGWVKKFIVLSVPVVFLVALVLAFTIQPILPLHDTSYNSYVIALCNLLLVLWILIYYRQLFIQLKIIRLEREPLFWISTGLLFYGLGSFFAEGFMQVLIERSPALATRYYYSVTVVLLCLLYIMFIISFLCRDIFKLNGKQP